MSSSFSGGADFHHALATLLANLRNERQTSQGTLAAELGVDQATVSRVESGHRRLTVGETFAWLEALGMETTSSASILRALWDAHGGRPPGFWAEHPDD